MALTKEGKANKDILMVLLIIHLVVAVCKLIVFGVLYGLGDIILCFTLFCAYFCNNFCQAYIYMIGCLFLSL